MSTQRLESGIHLGDSRKILPGLPDNSYDMVLADPPYEDPELINMTITEGLRISRGPVAVFMYAEDLIDVKTKPDQVLHWVKPISTKNTIKKYSRFVEVIWLKHGTFFNQGLHWSTRSGVFTDGLIDKRIHPHAKPESLIEKLIKLHCPEGGSILDPFSGSGTVHRVGTRMGRSVTGIELNKDYWLPSWQEAAT